MEVMEEKIDSQFVETTGGSQFIDCNSNLSHENLKQQTIDISLDQSQINQLICLQENVTLLEEKENARKNNQNKQRHKKLKQKLVVMSQQLQEEGTIKEIKDVASSNKSRLMKLAIEFEKMVQTQAKDYQVIETILRQIQKIIDHKREHDLLILRQSKFFNALSFLLKKFPSFHKNEATQAMLSIELGLKLLKALITLPTNREYFITSNQILVITSLLNTTLTKQQRKISIICLTILNSLLFSPLKFQLEQFLLTTLQVIFCSQLNKKLRIKIESLIFQAEKEGQYDTEYLLGIVTFFNNSMQRYCEKEFERATYEEALYGDSLNRLLTNHLESTCQTLVAGVAELIFEKTQDQNSLIRDQELSNGIINLMLFIFKLFNLMLHIDLQTCQKAIDTNHVVFLKAVKFVFEYSKENFKETFELKHLCSQIMIFLGNVCLQNGENQQRIRKSQLLLSLYNHPIDYLMETSLQNIYISSLCCSIHNNSENIRQAFQQNSTQPFIKFIEKQIEVRLNKNKEEHLEESEFNVITIKEKICPTLSRKTSVSSLNSNYSKLSMAESISTQTSCNIFPKNSQQGSFRLDNKFRASLWNEFLAELHRLEE